MLIQSFRPPELSTDRDELAASLQEVQQTDCPAPRLGSSRMPCRRATVEGRWMPLMEAEMELLRDRVTNQPTNPATIALASMLDAYSRNDATTFNKELFDYRDVLADYERSLTAHASELKAAGVASSEILSQPKINFEVFYNQFSPFYYAAVLYVVAFVLGALSWLGLDASRCDGRRSGCSALRSSFTRSPSSAGFTSPVGRQSRTSTPPPSSSAGPASCWRSYSKHSTAWDLGNIVASVIGFLTLLIAHFLSLDGDTFTVLLAVLDTQFWLATHVVCIALGYSTTFVAGFVRDRLHLARPRVPVARRLSSGAS